MNPDHPNATDPVYDAQHIRISPADRDLPTAPDHEHPGGPTPAEVAGR